MPGKFSSVFECVKLSTNKKYAIKQDTTNLLKYEMTIYKFFKKFR